MLVAFEFDSGGRRRRQRRRRVRQPGRRWPPPAGSNFALFTLLRLGRRSCWSWWSRCSAATRWPARRAGAACATCWRSRCRGPGCSAVKLVVALALLGAGAARCSPAPRCWPAPCATAGIRCAAPVAAEIPPGEGLLRLLGDRSATWPSTLLVVAGLAFLLSVLDRRAARRGRRRGAAVDPVEHPGPDHRARRDPQLPADPLQRRLAGPAVHAGRRPTTWSRARSRRSCYATSSGRCASGASPQGRRSVADAAGELAARGHVRAASRSEPRVRARASRATSVAWQRSHIARDSRDCLGRAVAVHWRGQLNTSSRGAEGTAR